MNLTYSKEQQKINRAEEQRRKKVVLEERRWKGRCFRFGEHLMKRIPGLADGPEEEAMAKLERLIEDLEGKKM